MKDKSGETSGKEQAEAGGETAELRDASRRGFLKSAGKAAYVAPTLTLLPLVSLKAAAFSVPPPPNSDIPGGPERR